MPCDQVITIGVELGIADVAILKAALERAGFRVTQYGAELDFEKAGVAGTITGSTLRARYGDAEGVARQIKKAYATEQLLQSAKRYGWTVKKIRGAEDEYEVVRQY